jgi:hypothetical protein
VKRSFFFWKKMYSFGRDSIILTGNLFLWYKFLFLCDRNHILVKVTLLCGTSNKDFVWGLKISCQPGCQVDREYPTLINILWLCECYSSSFLFEMEIYFLSFCCLCSHIDGAVQQWALNSNIFFQRGLLWFRYI